MLSEYFTSLADVSFHKVGLHVHAVSVLGKKSDGVGVCVCFFGVFLCGFAVFRPPLCLPPSLIVECCLASQGFQYNLT